MTSTRYLTIFLSFAGAPSFLTAQGAARSPTVHVIPGLQFDILTSFTASLWMIAETSVRSYGEATLGRGFSIDLDVGVGGGKVLAGWGNVGGLGGGSLSGGFLRTWNRPRGLQPGQSFLGAEIRGYFSVLGYGGGYYHRISGPAFGAAHSFDLSLALWFRL